MIGMVERPAILMLGSREAGQESPTTSRNALAGTYTGPIAAMGWEYAGFLNLELAARASHREGVGTARVDVMYGTTARNCTEGGGYLASTAP